MSENRLVAIYQQSWLHPQTFHSSILFPVCFNQMELSRQIAAQSKPTLCILSEVIVKEILAWDCRGIEQVLSYHPKTVYTPFASSCGLKNALTV